MGLKVIWGTLLGLWLVFVLMGRGGFVHLMLLVGISTIAIDLVSIYRARNVRDLPAVEQSPEMNLGTGQDVEPAA